MRLAAFLAAFVVPFAVAALPLLSLAFEPVSPTSDEGRLALSDVPVQETAQPESAPLAMDTSDSSPGCGGSSIVAIEG